MRYRIAAVCLLVVVAGCGGGSGGDDGDGPIVASASPATVTDAALAATGYERVERSNATTNTTVTLEIRGDVQAEPTFEVRATTRRVVYERRVAGGIAAVGVLAVPGVKPAEALAAPVDPFDDRRVAANVTAATTYGSVRDVDRRDAGSTRLLGTETAVTRVDATARHERSGATAAVRITAASVRHEGDFVTVVAVVPRGADESDAIDRLVDGVRH